MNVLTRYILSSFGGKVVKREEVERACGRFDADVGNTINYMISYKYFVRILRGLYYVKTLEEFRFKKSVDIYAVLPPAMKALKVNWYFGLHTALRLNGLTHEYFDTISVMNDSIFRPKEIRVADEKVKFVKLKRSLFGFGTVSKDHIVFSDVEKTLLDFVYVSRYRSIPEGRIVSIVEEYGKNAKPEKMRAYLKFYPDTVGSVTRRAGLI
jgi:predicted transcriptional regulator of viral defense system